MKKIIAILMLAGFAATPVLAAEGHVRLDPAPIDVRDVASLQSGARTFVNHCLNCHSASLMRYNRLQDLGLTEAQIKDNLLFTAEKVGEVMSVAMPKKEAKEWFGAPPPDLSVTARSRGADWLYTYLRGFYRDPTTATGWNNTVFERVGMPHVLWNLQGQRVLVQEPVKDNAGNPQKDGHGNAMTRTRFETISPGTMSPAEYDQTVRDLVNYMTWMSEPNQLWRKQVGYVVLFMLGLLVLVTWLLYKEFWKDVH
jgi:ubiquinol-cytochrome c reductase cytochrome c1 subunit